MNDGVTPDPPHEIRRSERTASDVNPGAFTNDTKNAGGPIMNVISSRSMISRARTGSHLAMGTTRRPDTPSSTPFSRPEMWAIGAGSRMASSGPSPCTSVMVRALCSSARWLCRATLGVPVEPEVPSATATDAASTGDGAVRMGAPPGRSVSLRTNTVGPSRLSMASTSAAPARWWIGAATAPRRQQARNREMAGHPLASCHDTVDPGSTPSAASPPAISEISCSNGVVPSSASSSDSSVQGPPGCAQRSVSGWVNVGTSSIGVRRKVDTGVSFAPHGADRTT